MIKSWTMKYARRGGVLTARKLANAIERNHAKKPMTVPEVVAYIRTFARFLEADG